MSTVGIITEYNPFHNGHIYNIKRAKELTGADSAVIIMSGSFVQRGEAAVIDKWKRAQAAVECGADLVIELPFVYASQTAEIFASGAVRILDAMNICDYMAFGSEADDLSDIRAVSELLAEEPEEYVISVRSGLRSGLSFPAAREKALKKLLEDRADVIAHPNNILAAEYVKTLIRIGSAVEPVNIKRNTDFNSEVICGDMASATAVRAEIMKIEHELANLPVKPENPSSAFREAIEKSPVASVVPKETLSALFKFFEEHGGFIKNEDIFSVFLADFLRYEIEEDIFDMDGDILNRIERLISEREHGREVMKSIKTRNYTQTRINRAVLNSVFKITDYDMEEFKEHTPGFIRILSANRKGFELIKMVRMNSDMEIINKFSETRSLFGTDSRIAEMEKTATDMYYYLLSKYSGRIVFGADYKNSPRIVK